MLPLGAFIGGVASFGQRPFDTDAVGPERFVAAHGRKAIVMGYATGGLEAWVYPLQVVRDYSIGFREAGETTEVRGEPLLRRVTYEPQAIVRTYIGPDYLVRERLFVPVNEQAILLTYTVEARHPVDIVIHFTPVLDLMWPMSIGGQSVQWNQAASAYVLEDGRQQYSALVGSPAATSHDATRNTIEAGSLGNRLAFTVRAGGSVASHVTVVVAKLIPGASGAAERMQSLIHQQPAFEREAADHIQSSATEALLVTTPDPAVNQQFAWARLALDQAWVCNPVLGCGLVAGYGPSRNARRPQYDWFFAGDGLIATDSLTSIGAYDRAREELAFIARYQDQATGMIWHEMSQSADPASWATAYPYMFVHVDITFQYLAALERYVSASGDRQFLAQHWDGVAAAYRYCLAAVNPGDSLPRIPAGKLGGDEQDKIAEDLDLSLSWIAASSAFSHMAAWTGHAQAAANAERVSQRARSAAATRYWDAAHKTWIDGYNGTGSAIERRGIDGVRLAAGHLLDQPQTGLLLDQFASADFQTDWGTRGVAASSSQYDPSSYSKGSVSALATAGVATAFWEQHRPASAFSMWNGLLSWGTLDSMGHLHELLAGDVYHQQSESVPEQTWSSAAVLSSTVHGLLGLEREAETNRLTFAPHLPASWPTISVENIKVGGGKVGLKLTRVQGGLAVAAENSGSPATLRFSPEIPLGARLVGAEWNGQPVQAQKEVNAQDMHATMIVTLPHGASHGLIRYNGGVSLSVSGPAPMVGEASRLIKITGVAWKGATLVLEADVPKVQPVQSGDTSVLLWAQQAPTAVRGASLTVVSPGVFRLSPNAPSTPGERGAEAKPGPFRHTRIEVELPNSP